MTTAITAFPVTIVSTDRNALRELTWSLRSLGLHSISSADWSKTAMWRLLERPSLLLLDARDREEIQNFLEAPRSTLYKYPLAFHDAITEAEAAKLLDLGAEDIVGLSGDPGELLTRVKAGLRRVEFEHRLTNIYSSNLRSGLTTGKGFARRLQSKMENRTNGTESVVIALSIDLQEILSSQFGSLVSEMANNTLAGCLEDQTTDNDFYASLDDGLFLVYLENSEAREGVQFAELIVKEFKAQNVLAPEFGARISVSGTVLALPEQGTAGEVVSRTLKAFGQVKDSGGNLILDAAVLEQSFSTWERQVFGPSPFRATMAKHIMEPLPFVLPVDTTGRVHDDPLGMFSLRSKGPRPTCTVVVDRQGRFLGVLAESFFEGTHDVSTSLEEHLVHSTATVECKKPLSDLSKAMDESESGYLIVLDGEKPVGYLTPEKLASMDSLFVTPSPSLRSYEVEHDLESLVVPAC